MALAFVSHRMEEIFRVADRAAVLRNGASVGEKLISEATERELVDLMTGGGELAAMVLQERHEDTAAATAPVLLSSRPSPAPGGAAEPDRPQGRARWPGRAARPGTAAVVAALFGAATHKGSVKLDGQAVLFRNPRQAQRAGVAYVPGEPQPGGLCPSAPSGEPAAAGWRDYGTPLRLREARADATAAVHLAIKIDTLDEPVSNLSGGNAQKVVIGKWLMREPRLLLLDDPTKGVDVNAKAEFYRLLHRLQEQGTTILFHSSDDSELLGLCQRVLVMQDGHVRAELTGDTLDKQHLVAASMGAGVAVSAP